MFSSQRKSIGEIVPRNDRGQSALREIKGGNGMKDRKKQRMNRKVKHKEEMIDKRNSFGNRDLTPYNAVLQMRTKDKAAIALK